LSTHQYSKILPIWIGYSASRLLCGDEKAAFRATFFVQEGGRYVGILSKQVARRRIDSASAISGNDDPQILREQNFEVAIFDLKLKDMDGAQRVKSFKNTGPQPPVMIFAALD
jgi:DNA-binding NtrC family response regulator